MYHFNLQSSIQTWTEVFSENLQSSIFNPTHLHSHSHIFTFTQTIRFWGLQHVHWCEGSCCWFAAAKQVGLRCSQGFARSTGDVRQPGRLVSGGYPGRRLVCSRASSIGLRCRFWEVHRRHLMHGGTQTIRFWGLQHVHWCEGSCCWFAAAKQVGLRCSQGFARSTGDVWHVPEHHLLV